MFFSNKNFANYLISFCFFILLLILAPSKTFAFFEDFLNPSLPNWQVFPNNAEVRVENSLIKLDGKDFKFPYLFLKEEILNKDLVDNFEISVKFKFPNQAIWGSGFCLGNYLPENGETFKTMIENNDKICMVKLWQDIKGSYVEFNHCPQGNCDNFCLFGNYGFFNPILQGGFFFNRNEFYNLIVKRTNLKYSIKITNASGNHIILDYSDERNIQRVPTNFWIGCPVFLFGNVLNSWQKLEVDYLKIKTSSQTFASPIFIIPGLGASWNTEAILFGEKKPQEEWQMTPFIKIYDNLIATLENGNYQRGENLFVFNYDWRQPVQETALELKDFIDNNIKDGESVILIGHSLGGLVSRAYWQNPQNSNKVEKIITLGTPHQGVVQAYEALAGGKISETPNWTAAALNIFLHLRTPFYKTVADTIRQEALVLNDLLPTFEFIKKGRRVVPLTKLSYQNQWLATANSSLTDFSPLEFISGQTGINTTEWLKIKSTPLVDRLLGLWPDGTPYKFLKGAGDETVLLKSSYLEGENPYVFNITHRNLPAQKETIEKILEILEINPPVSTETIPYSPANSLIFMIASPATLKIISPDNKVLNADSQGFVIIPNPSPGSYQAVLSGTTEGEYHFLLGQLFNQNLWTSYRGEITPGQNISYQFDIDPSSPTENPLSQNEETQLLAALEEVKNLNAQYPDQSLMKTEPKILEAIDKINSQDWSGAVNKVKKAIDNLFAFRKAYPQLVILNKSKKPISLLTDTLASLLEKESLLSPNQAKREFLKARKKMSLSWRLVRLQQRRRKLNKMSLVVYKTGEEYIDKGKKFLKAKNYPTLSAYSYSALHFFKEIPF